MLYNFGTLQIMEYRIGKNAQDNFDIIDGSHPDDIWFHIENLPSCHVVMKKPMEKMAKKEVLKMYKQCAVLCKQHSKYKSHKNVVIIYTAVKNVSKTDKVGSVSVIPEHIKRIVI